MNRIRWIRWAFLLVAVAGLGGFLWMTVSSAWLLVAGGRARGEIRTREKTETRVERVGVEVEEAYAPVVAFATADGREVVFTSPFATGEGSIAIGDEVPVVYSPGDPAFARVKTFGHLFGGAVMSLVMGVMFLLGAGLTMLFDHESVEPGRGSGRVLADPR